MNLKNLWGPPRDNISGAMIIRPEAALDEISLLTTAEPDPVLPNIAVHLRNNNTSNGIVATVRWKADKQFTLNSIENSGTVQFDTREQEIRVPPGGIIFVGRERLYKLDSWTGDDLVYNTITRTYSISGAQYTPIFRDPLPAAAEIRSFLFLYKIQNDHGATIQIAVNQNMQFGIDAFFISDRKRTAASTVPGGQSLFSSDPDNPVWRLDMTKSTFIRY